MKKTIVFLTIFSFGLMIVLNSCKKKEEEYTPEALPTATITGIVWANLNLANDTNTNGFYSYNPEKAPEGTTVIATLNAADLVSSPEPGYNYKTLVYKTTVDANGEYTLSIPANGDNVNVTLKFIDFEYDQTYMGTYPLTKTERTVFYKGDEAVTVVANDVKIVDVTYSF